MNMKRRRKHTKCKTEDSSSDDEEECKTSIYRRGNNVYFYSNVSKQSICALIKELGEACKSAIDNVSQHAPAVYLWIHSDGGCAYSGLVRTLELVTSHHSMVSPCTVLSIERNGSYSVLPTSNCDNCGWLRRIGCIVLAPCWEATLRHAPQSCTDSSTTHRVLGKFR